MATNSKPFPARRSKAAPRAPREPAPPPRVVRLPALDSTGVPDVAALVAETWTARELEHDQKEVGRDAAFRAGSQGLFVDGTSTGSCHRAAYARFVGAEEPAREGDDRDANKELMFSAGRGNEDLWTADLASWTGRGGVILREEEIPIRAEIDGVPLTGRPDIVLAVHHDAGSDAADSNWQVRPVLGLELKLVCSIGTAVEVLFHGPKLPHLVQAARYMTALSDQAGHAVPYQIWYTNTVVIPIPSWSFITKHLPDRGAPGSEFIEYSAAKGEATKIPPFRIGYDIRFADDPEQPGVNRLYFRRVRSVSTDQTMLLSNGASIGGRPGDRRSETDTPWTHTIVTREGLDDFWRMVRDVGEGFLGPRPKNLEYDGKGSWPKCNFCGWAPVCNALERDPQAWLAEINRRAQDRRAALAAAEASSEAASPPR